MKMLFDPGSLRPPGMPRSGDLNWVQRHADELQRCFAAFEDLRPNWPFNRRKDRIVPCIILSPQQGKELKVKGENATNRRFARRVTARAGAQPLSEAPVFRINLPAWKSRQPAF